MLLVCLNNLILMMNIASRCKTLFYRLVAVGLGVTYGFQVFLTVGGAIKLIPMTGVTLPFVSYGGKSIISSLVMFSLINGMYNMRHDEGEYENDRKEKMLKTKPKNSKKRRTPADIVEGSKKGLRNRATNIISFIFVGLFAIMIIYLCMFNIKDAKNVINNPYNKEVDNQAEKVVRGDIYSADGTLLQLLILMKTALKPAYIHKKSCFHMS